MQMKDLKEKIASSAMVDIYKYGDCAVKLFKPECRKTQALYEALTHARVEATGLPVPVIREVSVIDGRWAITMDLIPGHTMEEMMDKDPGNIDKYLNDLVDIQLKIHEKHTPKLSKLKDKMARQINSLDNINDVTRYELLTRLESMPKHTKLCHLLLTLKSPEWAEKYMDLFCEKTHTSKRYVQEWLPLVAAARLTEHRPEETELLMKWLDVVQYE